MLTDEDKGGFGGNWQDGLVVVKACGYHASAVPLPEAIPARRLAETAKLDVPDDVLTISPQATGKLDGPRFTGELRSVPWGRDASHIVAVLDGTVLIVCRADAHIERHHNSAGEPRDTLRFEGAKAAAALSSSDVLPWLALLRTGQMAGVLDHALELSVGYTRERQQFGRPLAQFQAVQQQLAVFAEETAAAGMAAAAAFKAMDRGEAGFEIAADQAARQPGGAHGHGYRPSRPRGPWVLRQNIRSITSRGGSGPGRPRPAMSALGPKSLAAKWRDGAQVHSGRTLWPEANRSHLAILHCN